MADQKPEYTSCFTGTLHVGTPRGKIESILDIPTYITHPPNTLKPNGHIILYFPDVWGLSNNASLLMDGFADAGYLVCGIDYFRGDPISRYRPSRNDPPPANFDHPAWLANHFAFASAHVKPWAKAVTERFASPETKVAVVGYCFGAPSVCQMLAQSAVNEEETEDEGVKVRAGAFAHPARVKEEDFRGLNYPLLLSCAEHDGAFDTTARNKAIDILQSEGKKYHLQLFQGVSHGFASRGDLDDPYEKWCKEQSHRAVIEWFDLWLVKSPS